MDSAQLFVFTGPTIAPKIAARHLAANYLPPVRLGDIYRVCSLYQPRIIGIIDGYFNQVPAVWHKEILYALSQGVTIFGAASMGALRAAELDQMGMIGCGKIYQAYRDGVLPPFIDERFEDDDEVAVIHSPAELGYLAASEAMINIRVTLTKAMQQGVIAQSSWRALSAIAKQRFYPERSYPGIIEEAVRQGLAAEELAALGEWLKTGAVDQKQLDAIEMLTQIAGRTEQPQTAHPAEPTPFEHTSQWQVAIAEIENSHHQPHPAINELRLTPGDYFQALEDIKQHLHAPDEHSATDRVTDISCFHRQPEKLEQLFAQHWRQRQASEDIQRLSPLALEQRLLDHLRQSGTLAGLEKRASDKQQRLTQAPNPRPDPLSLSELERLQLSDWYFSSRLGSEIPERLEKYVAQLGLEDVDAFYAMLLDEYLYLNPET